MPEFATPIPASFDIPVVRMVTEDDAAVPHSCNHWPILSLSTKGTATTLSRIIVA